jgi:hypothetical protein
MIFPKKKIIYKIKNAILFFKKTATTARRPVLLGSATIIKIDPRLEDEARQEAPRARRRAPIRDPHPVMVFSIDDNTISIGS